MAASAASEQRVTVVINAQAGAHGTEDVSTRLRELFAARNIEIDIVSMPQIEAACSVGPGAIIVAAGGDGTVSTVASRLAGSSTRLGILPLGTLNHFAQDVGIPLDLEQAVATVAAGRTTALDVGEVHGRVFVNNCSLGVYPSIVQGRDELRRRGHWKWTAFILATLRVIRRQHRLLVRLEADGDSSIWRTPFVMVGNNEYDVAGLRVAGRSRLDKSLLFAYIAPGVHVRDLPRILLKELFERILHRAAAPSDTFRVFSAKDLWIDARGRRTVHVALDGEVAMMELPLHFRSRASALNVLVPGE